jgi:hypothetical protein
LHLCGKAANVVILTKQESTFGNLLNNIEENNGAVLD